MALIDFYQLVDLHKLRHSDASFLPIHPHPLPMSTTPPRSLVQPGQFIAKTPKRDPSVSRNVPGPTPGNCGAAVRKKVEGNTDRDDGYAREDYDEYIREDLNSRVLVDFEVFLKSVLHVPPDWKTKWKATIEAVKADDKFVTYHGEYCHQCGISDSLEKLFYEPLMKTTNAVLDVVALCNPDGVSGNPQYYRVNSETTLRGGVMNKHSLAPDLVVLHEEVAPSTKGLHWANALHVLEVKPHDGAVCDGERLPRLVVDGIDPISTHALPPCPKRYVKGKTTSTPTPPEASSEADPPTVSAAGSELGPPTTSAIGPGPTSSASRKRQSEGAGSQRNTKKRKTGSIRKNHIVLNRDDLSQTATRSSTPPEPKVQAAPTTQVCRYLLEMFSIPLLRSHATVCLVDRDRLQLYHANRSVILVSSAINFSEGEGLEKFIATIIAFRRLSFQQNGVIESLGDANANLTKKPVTSNDRAVRRGNQLCIPKSETNAEFTLTLGDVISRDPATIGRSTVVLKATSDRWPGKNLVVKISWPGSGRIPESQFLAKARDEAEKAEGKWPEKHLPKVYATRDIPFDEDSTLESVAKLFQDAKFKGGEFTYEQRTLRIIVQEELQPLKALDNARDIGQVFVDIACIHRWLHDYPGILHRDLSLNNIMCRIIEKKDGQGKLLERKVYGVLTDYDLSSWTKELRSDYSRTSQQRTGTPPYMAHELLSGKATAHLYRHDIESLFYIMLLVCGRHTFGRVMDRVTRKTTRRMIMQEETSLPYQNWFDDSSYSALGSQKSSFFSEVKPIELPSTFEDFRWWLSPLQISFATGFARKTIRDSTLKSQQGPRPAVRKVVPFDDETLDGNIDYSMFIDPVRWLGGDLEGLIIRYDPKTTPSTSTGTTHREGDD